jgi:hypothetical protein
MKKNACCANCYTTDETAGVVLKACSRCQLASYCSRECQGLRFKLAHRFAFRCCIALSLQFFSLFFFFLFRDLQVANWRVGGHKQRCVQKKMTPVASAPLSPSSPRSSPAASPPFMRSLSEDDCPICMEVHKTHLTPTGFPFIIIIIFIILLLFIQQRFFYAHRR